LLLITFQPQPLRRSIGLDRFLILDVDLQLIQNPLSKSKILMRRGSGTLVGGLVWLPVLWQNSYNSQLTEWIQSGERVGLLAWVSVSSKPWRAGSILPLPVEAPALPVVIASGGVC